MDRIQVLRLGNYEYFLYAYRKTGSGYLSNHQILNELETLVCYDESIKSEVKIGECIFKYRGHYREGVHQHINYDFIKVV